MQQIQVPFDIFERRVKQDYSNWRAALPREFLQNGVDAHSKRIDFIFEGNYLHVKNDGRPMSLETCQKALLTLGGTDKGLESVGGFGIAKEILYFAWKEWSIRSADYKVTGRGCFYEVETGLPFMHGVHSIISKDPDINENWIKYHINTCQTAADLYVNGELQIPHLKGRTIRNLGWATLHKRSGRSEYIKVRVNGVTMFQTWNKTDVDLVLELHGDTKNILTANRDGLKEAYNAEFQQILREIQVNKKSALRPQDCTETRIFPGKGLTRSQKREIQAAQSVQTQVQTPVQTSFPPQPLANSVPEFVDRPAFQVDHRPDVLVHINGNNKVPTKYQPENWSKKFVSFVSMWKLVLKQILEDNNEDRIFGIGIVIDPNVHAMYKRHQDVDYFLLNPTTLDFSLQAKDRLTLIEEIKMRGCHEIAHLLSGSDHDEDFVLRMETVLRNTWKSNRAYKKIAKIRKIDLNTEIS